MRIRDEFLYSFKKQKTMDAYNSSATRSIYIPGLITKIEFFVKTGKWLDKKQLLWKIDGRINFHDLF